MSKCPGSLEYEIVLVNLRVAVKTGSRLSGLYYFDFEESPTGPEQRHEVAVIRQIVPKSHRFFRSVKLSVVEHVYDWLPPLVFRELTIFSYSDIVGPE